MSNTLPIGAMGKFRLTGLKLNGGEKSFIQKS